MYETDGIFLNELALNISLQGRIVLDERWHRSLVNDPFSRLYFVKEGQGWLIPEEGEKIAMESGRMYFVPAGLTFSYGCTHLEKIFFHINIAGEDGTDIFSATKKIGVLPFMPQEYEALYENLFRTDCRSLLRVKSAVYRAAAAFAELFRLEGPERRYSKTVLGAMRLILRDTRIDWRLEDLCEKLYVSESMLRKNFKKETGMSLRQYIEKQVFAKAKTLLAANSLSIEEISERLGFCDRFYFSSRFHAVFGTPPAAYRNSISYRKKD